MQPIHQRILVVDDEPAIRSVLKTFLTSLGHGREPLIEPGSPKRLGTTSSTIAAKVFADRVKELEQVKVDRAVLGVERRMTLGAFVPQHLALRRQEATVTELWLKETHARLTSGAIHFFGADRPLLFVPGFGGSFVDTDLPEVGGLDVPAMTPVARSKKCT